MGRPLQPSAISEAKGYYLKHKERKPKGEPVVTQPLGGPPKHLLPEEKKIWKEMAKHLPPGVAKVTDRDTFEIMVCLFTKERARTIKISERSQDAFHNVQIRYDTLRPYEGSRGRSTHRRARRLPIRVHSSCSQASITRVDIQIIHGGARVMAPASRIFVAREIDSNGDLNGPALFLHALVALAERGSS